MICGNNKEQDFVNMIGRIRNIICSQDGTSDISDARNFLSCAYGLFSNWKNFFQFQNIKSMNITNFKSQFEHFLDESGNGSWSGLARHKKSLLQNPRALQKAVIDLLKCTQNFQKIKQTLKDLCLTNRGGHIGGMSVFLCTAILFASDEGNFIVVDSPVKEYFGILDDEDTINNYGCIIGKTKDYAANVDLPMWHINKAYAIFNNNMNLKIKNLRNQCSFSGNPRAVHI